VTGVCPIENMLARHGLSAMKDLSVVPTSAAMPSCKTSETLTEHSDFLGHFKIQTMEKNPKYTPNPSDSSERSLCSTYPAEQTWAFCRKRSVCGADIHC